MNLAIPDGDAAGRQDIRNLASDIVQITSVRVRLQVVGEFNGDLYGYLRHTNSGQTHIAVLLNRPGRSATNNWGYSDSGLNVTLADAAPTDIHNYQEVMPPPTDAPLTGAWQPDARFVDPLVVIQTSPRSAFLSGFTGMSASGEWTLFLADMDSGATNFLVSWGLEITGKTQPTITWTNPSVITYGTGLGPEQLNASADVPGTFTYHPPAGTVLPATNNHPLTVSFLPADPNAYVSLAASVTLEVLPRPLTITASNTSKAYGTPLLFAGTEFSATGLVNDDIVTNITLTSAGASAIARVGNYEIFPTAAAGPGLGNYTIGYSNGLMTVLPVPLLVQANDASRGYGQTNPAFTATLSGWVNDENATVLSDTLSFTTLAVTNSPIGIYAIEPSGLTATNYVLSFSNGLLTVTANALLVSVNSVARAYGTTNPPLTGTLTGVLPGDDISATYAITADTNSPVGTYPITITLADPGGKLGNYAITTNLGTLTVEPAPLLVQADDVSRTYGETNPVFTATLSGWVNGENSNVLTGMLTFNTPAETNSPIGLYPIVPGGLSATNYALTFSNGTQTVTGGALLVFSAPVTRTYGGTNPPLTGTLTGVVPGDDITVNYSTTAATNSPIGIYPITAIFSDPGNKIGNYTITTNLGSITVTATPLLVQADDTSRTYGVTNPVFTATFSGWVNGEDSNALSGALNFTTAAVTNSPPGIYPIAPSGLSATNYALTFANGTLTVSASALLVNMESVSRPYGTTNPPLTGTLTGVLPGDTITASYTTAADTNSPVGNYPITLTFSDPGGQLGNYSISTNFGWLTITPAASAAILASAANPALLGTVVTFQTMLSAQPPSVGVPAGTVQFKIDGSDYGPPVALTAGQAEFSSATLAAGTHAISVEYAGDGNFLGATALLTPAQRINSVPVAGADFIASISGEVARTPVSALLANDSDPDGDVVQFEAVNAMSAEGGIVSQINGWVYYTPPPITHQQDSFTYFVRDGWGGAVTGTVVVLTLTNHQIAPQMLIENLGSHTLQLSLLGMPWANYTIEATESLDQPNWTDLAVGTADRWGNLVVQDVVTPGETSRFYRGVFQGVGAVSVPFRLDLNSSANSALPGTPVTFALQLNAFAPEFPQPQGAVQFQIDGTNYGAPVSFVGSVASLSTAALPLGWHSVAAEFAGDPNYRNARGIMRTLQLINTPPQARADVGTPRRKPGDQTSHQRPLEQ
ncbi:MAG: MBG domain-containing protein [Verrucomicrobiota bacterium]